MDSQPKRGLLQVLWAMYLDFAINTSIHGLRYITEDGRRLVERLLWILVVTCGLVGAVFMASNFWSRFVNSPTRASVETNHYPTWRIPFPAITLCNANRIFRSKAEILIDDMVLPEGMTREDALQSFALIQELVQPLPTESTSAQNATLKQFQDLFDKHNFTMDDMMQYLDQGCMSLLERCKWKGTIMDCSLLFEERKSYLGYCCSFNYRGVKQTTSEDGSAHLLQVDRKTERTRYYSHRMGLTVLLNPQIEDYFYSTLFSAGVRMLVHDPDDYPDDTALEKILPVRRELLLRVTATSSYCTEAVRDVDPNIRGCVFPGERKLNLFPVYSSINCLTECRVLYLTRLCNCTPFYYYNVGKYKVCNLLEIPCLNRYYYAIRTRKKSLESNHDHSNDNDHDIECDCPALCSDVVYDVQLSSGDFKASQFQRSAFFENVNVTNRILFHFYFGNHVSIRTRRDIISSWNNLLSSLGGVFSLFLGCSFVSAIEVVYFFTLRLFLRYRTSQTIKPVDYVEASANDQNTLADLRRLKHYPPLALTTGVTMSEDKLAMPEEPYQMRYRFL